MLPTAKKGRTDHCALDGHQEKRAERVRCCNVRCTRPGSRLREPQQSHRFRDTDRSKHSFSNATDQGQHSELVVLVARDPVKRHGQHEGREALEQLKEDGNANILTCARRCASALQQSLRR